MDEKARMIEAQRMIPPMPIPGEPGTPPILFGPNRSNEPNRTTQTPTTPTIGSTPGMLDKLAAALAKAQGEIKNAPKDSANPFFKSKYADLAGIWDACRGPLSRNELAVSQTTRIDPVNGLVLVTTLMHSSGQTHVGEMPVKAVKQTKDEGWVEDSLNPQAVGSALTYAKRQALEAIAGVAPEDDDDGNHASGRGEPTAKVKDPLREEILTVAEALAVALGGEKTPEALIREESSFLGKDSKTVSFGDPYRATNEKWLKGTLTKLKTRLDKHGMAEEPGASEAAELFGPCKHDAVRGYIERHGMPAKSTKIVCEGCTMDVDPRELAKGVAK